MPSGFLREALGFLREVWHRQTESVYAWMMTEDDSREVHKDTVEQRSKECQCPSKAKDENLQRVVRSDDQDKKVKRIWYFRSQRKVIKRESQQMTNEKSKQIISNSAGYIGIKAICLCEKLIP